MIEYQFSTFWAEGLRLVLHFKKVSIDQIVSNRERERERAENNRC